MEILPLLNEGQYVEERYKIASSRIIAERQTPDDGADFWEGDLEEIPIN